MVAGLRLGLPPLPRNANDGPGSSDAPGVAALSGPACASLDLNNVDTDLDTANDALAVGPAASDFSYWANGGTFGNAALFWALRAIAYKPANGVDNILRGINDTLSFVDNFDGNNNDLASGNVHVGPFSGSFAGLTQAGNYTISISGLLKGNSGLAHVPFSVTSNIVTIGGCTP